MADLEKLLFLGWSLDFDLSGVRRPVGVPGVWSISVDGGAGRYAISGSFALTIGKILIECVISQIPLQKTGSAWVPVGGALTRFAMWRSEEHHDANSSPFFRVRLGGAILEGDDLPFGWDPTDGSALLQFDNFLFQPSAVKALPAEIEAVSGMRIGVSANGVGTIKLPRGLWQARLHQWDLATKTAVHTTRYTSAADSRRFDQVAATGPFTVTFEPADATPLWLHGGPLHGPGLIVDAAMLSAGFTEDGGGGHLLSALALVSTAKTKLTSCGILNSWNEPEVWRWSGSLPLVLAFSTSGTGWNGAMLAPGPDVPLRRILPSGGNLPIHGGVGGHWFDLTDNSTAELRCSGDAAEKDQVPASHGVTNGLKYLRTRPWIHFRRGTYSHPRYGETYIAQAAKGAGATKWSPPDGTTVLRFQSSLAGCGGLPAVPREYWKTGSSGASDKHAQELDTAMAELVIDRPHATHESGLADTTDAPVAKQQISSLFGTASTPFPLRLTQHAETRHLANPILAEVSVKGAAASVPSLAVAEFAPDQNLEYAILWPGAPWMDSWRPPQLSATDGFLEALYGRFLDPGVPIGIGRPRYGDTGEQSLRAVPWLIAKLGRQRKLADILSEIKGHLQADRRPAWDAIVTPLLALIDEVDGAILRTDWVGAIALELDLDLAAMPQLQAMVPTGDTAGPSIRFVAITPQSAASNRWGGVSGAIDWQRSMGTAYVASAYKDLDEARFWTDKFNVRWRDGALTYFRSEATLELRTFLGTGVTRSAAESSAPDKQPTKLQIIGSARRRPTPNGAPPSYDFTFAADATRDNPDGLKIYPITEQGTEAAPNFIQEVRFRKVEVVAATTDAHTPARAKEPIPATTAKVMIDGDVQFKPPDWLQATIPDFLKGKKVSFFNLGIGLPSLSDLNIKGLQLSYPDLRFDLDLPHVGLIGDALKLKFQSFTLDWNELIDLGAWPQLGLSKEFSPAGGAPSFDFKLPRIILGGRLGFGTLPELFSGAFSEFSLDLRFALNLDLANASLAKSFYIGVGGFGFEGLNLNLLPFLEISIKRLTLESNKAPKGYRLTAIETSISVLKYPLPYSVSGGFFSSGEPGTGDSFWLSATRTSDTPTLFDFNYGFVGQNIVFREGAGGGKLVRRFLEAPLLANAGAPPAGALTDNIFENAWGTDILPAGDADSAEGKGWTFAAELAALWGILRGRAIIQDRGFRGLALFVDTSKPEARALKEWFGDSFGFVGLHHKGGTESDDYFTMSLTLPEMNLPAFRMVGGIIAVTLWTNGGVQIDFGFPWLSGATREWERTIGLIITPGQASAGFYFKKTIEHVPDSGAQRLTIGAGFAVQWGLGASWGGGTFKAWGRIGVYGVVQGEVTFATDSFDLVRLYVVGAVGVLVEGSGKIDWWIISVEVGIKATAEMRFELEYLPKGDKTIQLAAELYVSAYARACVGGGWFKVCKSITVGLSIPVHHRLTLG